MPTPPKPNPSDPSGPSDPSDPSDPSAPRNQGADVGSRRSYDHYYRYDELMQALEELATAYPQLLELSSIGKSHEGRPIPLVIVGLRDDTPHTDKPAFWVDGNIHATELAPASACVYFIEWLVHQYEADPTVRRCLATRVFYVCPRVNPDGAEWALSDPPRYVRSSTRTHPRDLLDVDGLTVEDIDGNGKVLWMRIADPLGHWKVSDADPRLLVRRDPIDEDGTYYRLLPEGHIEGYDGVTIAMKPNRHSLDLNRNFPAQWIAEPKQKGSGPYPTSEPEVRNVVDFIVHHPNITGGVAFHTYGGLLLRPYSHAPDSSFPISDLRAYEMIGAKGAEMTGYPAISVFHDFRSDGDEIITGALDDWMFEHLGVFTWTVEIWSPRAAAGVTYDDVFGWYRDHPVEDDLRLLAWSDEVLGGEGYLPWRPFEHPQLGPVEIGGWDTMFTFRNPPAALLEAEIARFPRWLVWHALLSPHLVVHEASLTPMGDGTFRVCFVVDNTGYLPTSVSHWAAEKRLVSGVITRIDVREPSAVVVVIGAREVEHGQLAGRHGTEISPYDLPGDPTTHRLKQEWVVRATAATTIELSARHPRAGRVTAMLTIEPVEG